MSHAEILQLLENHLVRFILFCGVSMFTAFVAVLIGRATGGWFALMTMVWVLVQLAVAWWLSGHVYEIPQRTELDHFYHVRRMMLINFALDFLYAIIGWLLWALRNRSRRPLWKGFALAVWFQAVGLMVLDSFLLMRLGVNIQIIIWD